MEAIPEHIKEKFEKAGIRIIVMDHDFKLRELISTLSDKMVDAVIEVIGPARIFPRKINNENLAQIITRLAPSRTEDLLKHTKKHIIKQDFRNRQRFHNKKL